MLARLGPASFLSCGRDMAARFFAVPYTRIDIPPQYWYIAIGSILARNSCWP